MTFPCEHCEGLIEFEEERLNEIVICPHCGQATRLGHAGIHPAPEESESELETETAPRRGFKFYFQTVLIVLLLLFVPWIVYKIVQVTGIRDFTRGLGEMMGGLAAIAIVLFALWVAILWVFLPLVVYIYLRRISRDVADIRAKICE